MTGPVQTSSERQGFELRPLWLKSGLLQPFYLSSLPDGRRIAYSGWCLYICLWYTVFITLDVCVTIFCPLCVGLLLVLGLYKEDYSLIFKCSSFWDITFQLLKQLSLAKDHWRGFSTRNAHMRLVTKSDFKWWMHRRRSLFWYFNILVRVTAGGPVSPRGYM